MRNYFISLSIILLINSCSEGSSSKTETETAPDSSSVISDSIDTNKMDSSAKMNDHNSMLDSSKKINSSKMKMNAEKSLQYDAPELGGEGSGLLPAKSKSKPKPKPKQ